MSDTFNGTDSFDYDPETNTYRVEYDPRCDRPSLTLVSAIAAITGRKMNDLRLLEETLDSESLDYLFRPTERGQSRRDGRVEFAYHDFRVTVYSYGSIEIRPDDRPDGDEQD